MIETRLLYYFLAIAREQNITKAAEVLHITQPSLSKQMNDLEYMLGKKLLNRGNKKTTLTEDGAYFRSKAEEIISLLEKTESSFNEQEAITGDIYFGGAETHHIDLFVKIFKEIKAEYPNVHFHFQSGDASDMFEKLDKGLIDIALMIDPAYFSKYDYLELPIKEKFGILMSKEHPLANKECVSIDDLKNYPLFISRQESHTKNVRIWNNEQFHIIGTYNLIYNATYLVENNMGCALTIEGLVDTSGNRNLCYLPIYPTIDASLFIVTKKYQNQSKAVSLLIQKIKAKTGSI